MNRLNNSMFLLIGLKYQIWINRKYKALLNSFIENGLKKVSKKDNNVLVK